MMFQETRDLERNCLGPKNPAPILLLWAMGRVFFYFFSGPLGFGGEGPTSAMEGPKDS